MNSFTVLVEVLPVRLLNSVVNRIAFGKLVRAVNWRMVTDQSGVKFEVKVELTDLSPDLFTECFLGEVSREDKVQLMKLWMGRVGGDHGRARV